MSRIEKKPTLHPCPPGTDEEFMVRLTHKEMQCICNAVTGFYNVAARDRLKVSAEQILTIKSGLEKMNRAIKGDIVVVQ